MPRLLTAVMDVGTNKVEKFAYKPWGMRRNPANWAAEVVNDYPARFSRGYCMHEHLPNLGFINMGGRVYNARTNQFISPDPYRQAPDSWLNCNRFGYCMNNPVMYSDPTGEYFGIDDIIAMVVGGLANSIAQCVSGNVDNVGQFFAYFGVGAVSGEVAIYNPVAAGMIVGGSNAALNGVFSGQGVSFGNIFMGTCMGAVTSYAGTWLTNTFSGAVSSLTSGLNQFARNAITNITSGAAAGYIMGFGFSYLNNGDFGKALEEGKRGAIMGAATGTMGTIGQAIKLFKNGCNPWTGKREIFPDNDLVEQKALPAPAEVKALPAPEEPFLVTPDGVVLPKGCKIPEHFIENKYRLNDYGEEINGVFTPRIRIDQGTPPGFKGPNKSHFHINGKGKHIFDPNKWPYK